MTLGLSLAWHPGSTITAQGDCSRLNPSACPESQVDLAMGVMVLVAVAVVLAGWLWWRRKVRSLEDEER
jgi:hypothetical protein